MPFRCRAGNGIEVDKVASQFITGETEPEHEQVSRKAALDPEYEPINLNQVLTLAEVSK